MIARRIKWNIWSKPSKCENFNPIKISDNIYINISIYPQEISNCPQHKIAAKPRIVYFIEYYKRHLVKVMKAKLWQHIIRKSIDDRKSYKDIHENNEGNTEDQISIRQK